MTHTASARNAPQAVLVNGEPGASLSVLDRGLHYGDGLFETIACVRGRARFLTLHLERLALGCMRLGIELPATSTLRTEIETLAASRDRSIVKLVLTRGEAISRGYGYAGSETPTRIAFLYEWPSENEAATHSGVRVRTSTVRMGENPALAGVKHLSRLEQVLARTQLNAPAESELLMFSSSGRLVSGTMSNVFVVQGDRLSTPRLDLCGVAGVMRRVVLREASNMGLSAEERELGPSDVAAADELFLTSARIGIWPVSVIDGRSIRVGPLTQRIQNRLAPLLSEPADA